MNTGFQERQKPVIFYAEGRNKTIFGGGDRIRTDEIAVLQTAVLGRLTTPPHGGEGEIRTLARG